MGQNQLYNLYIVYEFMSRTCVALPNSNEERYPLLCTVCQVSVDTKRERDDR